MDSEEGFTPEGAVWQKSGWREVAELSRRLARLRPLQRLIAELGRGGGMGAMRRAPAQACVGGERKARNEWRCLP